MAGSSLTRRRFNRWLAAGLLAGAAPLPVRALMAPARAKRLRVAAIQMTPVLGDADANLNQAEQLIRQAIAQGAQWIALPEMFTSAAAFHPDMLGAIRSLNGAPLQMLKDLSREGDAVIGGSFLARRDGQVFNSFVLVSPDGSLARHDKDQPTYWENCYYRGGEDDGVLDTPLGPVGSALCWELIRARTARRLRGRVRMLVGGSCWWTLPDDAPADSPYRAANLTMLQQAPVHMARMLGVPVIHGSHAGRFEGFFSPELPDVPYDSDYLGEAMIVDARGKVLARRPQPAGAGVVLAELSLPAEAAPSEPVPERFWMPPQMPDAWKDSWSRWLDSGADYYRTVTLPYLQTGEVNEYVPPYMR